MKNFARIIALVTVLVALAAQASTRTSFRGFTINMGNNELSSVLKNKSEQFSLFVEVDSEEIFIGNGDTGVLYQFHTYILPGKYSSKKSYDFGMESEAIATLFTRYKRPIDIDSIYKQNMNFSIWHNENRTMTSVSHDRYIGDIKLPVFEVIGLHLMPSFFNALNLNFEEMKSALMENYSFYNGEFFDPSVKGVKGSCGKCIVGLLNTGELLFLRQKSSSYDWDIFVREPSALELSRIKSEIKPVFN